MSEVDHRRYCMQTNSFAENIALKSSKSIGLIFSKVNPSCPLGRNRKLPDDLNENIKMDSGETGFPFSANSIFPNQSSRPKKLSPFFRPTSADKVVIPAYLRVDSEGLLLIALGKEPAFSNCLKKSLLDQELGLSTIDSDVHLT